MPRVTTCLLSGAELLRSYQLDSHSQNNSATPARYSIESGVVADDTSVSFSSLLEASSAESHWIDFTAFVEAVILLGVHRMVIVLRWSSLCFVLDAMAPL